MVSRQKRYRTQIAIGKLKNRTRADPCLNAVCPGEICNAALIGVTGDPSMTARFDQGQKLEWFATLRARLGVTVTPDAIAYVTGGVAVGEVMTAGTVFGSWADNDVPEEPPAVWPRLRVIDGGRNEAPVA
jgi:opacity protein-like surface antigen